MSFDDVDLSDRSLFRAGFPHALFARLRTLGIAIDVRT